MDPDQCLLPEHGLFISPQGRVTACCVSVGDSWQDLTVDAELQIDHPGRLDFQTKFLRGLGPSSCDQCRYREHYSLRREKSQQIAAANPGPGQIVYADVTWGNICQLTCVMCNSTFSHTWRRSEQHPRPKWHMTLDQLKTLAASVHEASYIEIKGGDPLNLPYFTEFLTELRHRDTNAEIIILSHMQTLTDRQLHALSQHRVRLAMSVEATGKLYQWIRGGARTLDQAWQNLLRLRDHGLITEGFYFSSTLGLYNCGQWWDQHREIAERFRGDFGFSANWALNLITDPPEQSIYLVKPEIRQQWLDRARREDLIRASDYLHITDHRPVSVSSEEITQHLRQREAMRARSYPGDCLSLLRRDL